MSEVETVFGLRDRATGKMLRLTVEAVFEGGEFPNAETETSLSVGGEMPFEAETELDAALAATRYRLDNVAAEDVEVVRLDRTVVVTACAMKTPAVIKDVLCVMSVEWQGQQVTGVVVPSEDAWRVRDRVGELIVAGRHTVRRLLAIADEEFYRERMKYWPNGWLLICSTPL